MVGYLSSGLLFISSLMFMVVGLVFMYVGLSVFVEWDLFILNGAELSVVMYFDWVSLLFSSVVMFISSTVILYSGAYMSGDNNQVRFVLLVLLFVISMLMMIISPSLLSIMLGWDGLGLISYCLVVYYNNSASASAGMLTILINRVGDVGLLLGVGWVFSYGAWNIMTLHNLFDVPLCYVVYCVGLAGVTKSAQIPFSSWLPAAMAAPTPVSALVHSSTLVTAGVYLFIRFHWLVENNMMFIYGLMFMSLITMFLSGGAAMVEYDLKKIIALSTLSQLGLMMFTVSLSWVELSFFHLLTHALFKSLLFLCVGKVIHDMGGEQDIRLMGGTSIFVPCVGISFLLSNVALCGFPFMAGFYSKDMILELGLISMMNWCVVFILVLSTLFTSVYSVRVMVSLMIVPPMFFPVHSMYDSGWEYIFPLGCLSVMSVIGGGVLGWVVCSEPWNVMLSVWWKVLPLALVFAGVGVYALNQLISLPTPAMFVWFMSTLWFISKLSAGWMLGLVFSWGWLGYKTVDGGWVEEHSALGVMTVLRKSLHVVYLVQRNGLSVVLITMVGIIVVVGLLI